MADLNLTQAEADALLADKEICCPHLHIYREGFGDKWAMPVPVDRFNRTADLVGTLQDFMMYCNVIELPFIEEGLFHD